MSDSVSQDEIVVSASGRVILLVSMMFPQRAIAATNATTYRH